MCVCVFVGGSAASSFTLKRGDAATLKREKELPASTNGRTSSEHADWSTNRKLNCKYNKNKKNHKNMSSNSGFYEARCIFFTSGRDVKTEAHRWQRREEAGWTFIFVFKRSSVKLQNPLRRRSRETFQLFGSKNLPKDTKVQTNHTSRRSRHLRHPFLKSTNKSTPLQVKVLHWQSE